MGSVEGAGGLGWMMMGFVPRGSLMAVAVGRVNDFRYSDVPRSGGRGWIEIDFGFSGSGVAIGLPPGWFRGV
jgi:hypothetical protein